MSIQENPQKKTKGKHLVSLKLIQCTAKKVLMENMTVRHLFSRVKLMSFVKIKMHLQDDKYNNIIQQSMLSMNF